MDKVCWLLWDERARGREALGAVVRDVLGPAFLAAGVPELWIDVADEHARVKSPTPFPLGEPRVCALVNAFLDDLDEEPALTERIAREGFRVAAYHVEPSIYRDYGANAHHRARDWPDGQRSPGIVTVNLLERPARLSREAWVERWHEIMSPVSERIQPRARYVRNLVLAPLTPDAPPYEGIVEECWASPEVLSDPWRFYGAKNPWELAVNLVAILRAVTSFLTLWRVMTVPMSEYFLKTPAAR